MNVVSQVMKKDERTHGQMNDFMSQIDEYEDKIKNYEKQLKRMEKKRDLAKIEILTLEKKLDKFKEKFTSTIANKTP